MICSSSVAVGKKSLISPWSQYQIPNFSGFTKDMRAEMKLEWRISFTRAEHILVSSFNAPKLRMYIFALLLHRTYLAPLRAINEGHIR